ncbi:MAG: DUF5752 family protein [Candidatus Neomarinimicrobiota bacterium]|nr:DUF5752 family protein [Candidatus Neomarinimicrobiota bacterium]
MSKDNKSSINFQDLMLHRIHEILLVASPYDAFILEEDGRLTQQILYEYLGMNLSYAPRVWHAKNAKTGLQMLVDRSYDLVIVMMRIADMDPITFGEKVKQDFPDKPVILLAFDESEISTLPQKRLLKTIDRVYIWSGNANVFPAIIKNIEDSMNLDRDHKIADIRSIVMVEDNPRYYSIILPLIYRTALRHAQSLINRSLSDTDRLLLFRARPKILLASNFEDALAIYKKYRNNILGFISDVQFPKSGAIDQNAGIKLAEIIREKDSDMPIVLQSTNSDHKSSAEQINSAFIHKNSSTLIQDLKDFIINNFGFGDFIFRQQSGKEISRATTIGEFQNELIKLPKKSLQYHASKNHFSNWLAVRGEFNLSSRLRSIKANEYSSLEDLRKVIIDTLDEQIDENKDTKIVQFKSKTTNKKLSFVRISTGSLGGKARGLAFANNLLKDAKLNNQYEDITIRVPRIAVIGTDEFDEFMNSNNLWKIAFNDDKSDKSITRAFLKGDLSKSLQSTLRNYLSNVKFPIAVRSSSLLEDSQYQPLAGMYSTFMLPNADKSRSTRLNELEKAIKLVYASTFLKEPKALIKASVHHHEEEKMAVIIMELVGNKHENRFYPSASGLAQSFNYYPTSYMKRDEGVAYLALGLGRTIAEGEKSLRFAPKYPGIIPQYYSVKSTVNNSQNQFYALNLDKGVTLLKNNQNENTSSYELDVAEKDGELFWAGSVISDSDNKIRDNLKDKGARVITFPSLLKWKSAPVTELIIEILKIGEEALGCPVEIEFAINLNNHDDKKHEFCLLQIKPMVVGGIGKIQIDEPLDIKDIFCSSSVALGNGLINDIKNIIYIDPNKFDASKTISIAKEIEKINHLIPDGEKYILIGPGRWGSSDPWLGIPVEWDQISKAKVIIEYGMESFPVDPSFGSHFFQNVTSMRIGYFTINHKNNKDSIDTDWIKNQAIKKSTKFIDWIELDDPLIVTIDGQNGKGEIIKSQKNLDEKMDEQETSGI